MPKTIRSPPRQENGSHSSTAPIQVRKDEGKQLGFSQTAPAIVVTPAMDQMSDDGESSRSASPFVSQFSPSTSERSSKRRASDDRGEGEPSLQAMLAKMFDEQRTFFQKEVNRIADLTTKEVREVRSTCDARAVSAARLASSMTDRMDRADRRCDLLFWGLPVKQNTTTEEIIDYIGLLANHLQVALTRLDIVFARRTSYKAHLGKTPVVVQFRDVVLRNAVMHAFLKARAVSTCVLGFQCDLPITVTDNLTLHNSAIRKKATELKKQGKLEKVIVRNGLVSIFLAGRRHEIHDIGQIDSLLSE